MINSYNKESEIRQGRMNAWGFGIVFVVVNLHVLRNVASVPYLALYAVVALWTLNRAISRVNERHDIRTGLPLAWVLGAIIAFMSTIAISGIATAAYGLSRYLFAFPVFLAFVAYTKTSKDMSNHIRTMCLFFALGALTIPLQYLTGPIAFFADASERAGLERFASVFGSLTALGIAAGSYIALSQTLRARGTIFAILTISIGGIASLSKAAIANIALGLASHVTVGGKQVIRMLATLGVIITAGYFAVSYSTLLQESLAASATSFGVEGGTQNYDMSFQSSLLDRLITRPAENFAVLGTLGSSLVYITGGGFGMASTALVPPSASLAGMTHNQYAEFFSIAGLVGGTIFFAVLLTTLSRLWKLWRIHGDPNHGAVLSAFVLWIANSFFANGTAYQPVTASILFAALFVSCTMESREGTGSHRTIQTKRTVKERSASGLR